MASKRNWKTPATHPQRKALVTGVRLAGESEFQVTIHGNPASPFPPMNLRMSLLELQKWLKHINPAPSDAPATPTLRLVT